MQSDSSWVYLDEHKQERRGEQQQDYDEMINQHGSTLVAKIVEIAIILLSIKILAAVAYIIVHYSTLFQHFFIDLLLSLL